MRAYLLLLAFIICATACQRGNPHTDQAEGDTIPLRHARNLLMIQYDAGLEVQLRNPWDTTKILHRYLFVEHPTGESNEVIIPLRRAAVYSAVHCALIQELGAVTSIGGVCDLQYINLPFVQDAIHNGTIADLGNSMEPNIERMMDLQPDALMPSPLENSNGYGRLEQIGIPIIECADYMESSPLARAEWMRFYGRLFGCPERADSLFDAIEERYQQLCKLTSQVNHRPSLICDLPYSGQWMMPGQESTMGQLYQDAGANYLFSDLKGNGSIAVSMEQVADRGLKANFWLTKHFGPLTREQILIDAPLMRNTKATIWNGDTSTNGYYEETPFHPERLLESLIEIFHPELGIKAKKQYFCPLK